MNEYNNFSSTWGGGGVNSKILKSKIGCDILILKVNRKICLKRNLLCFMLSQFKIRDHQILKRNSSNAFFIRNT